MRHTPHPVIQEITALRKSAGITQISLAAAAGMNQEQLSALEHGVTKNPRIDTVIRLQVALAKLSGERNAA